MKKSILSLSALLTLMLISGCKTDISGNSYKVGSVGNVNRAVEGVVISKRFVDISGTQAAGATTGGVAGAVAGGAAGGDSPLGIVAGAVGGAAAPPTAPATIPSGESPPAAPPATAPATPPVVAPAACVPLMSTKRLLITTPSTARLTFPTLPTL